MVQRTLLPLLLAIVVLVPSMGRATPDQPFDVDTELQHIQQLVDEQRYPEALSALDALLARDVLDAGQLAIASSLRSLVDKAMGLEWKELERQRERERKKAERLAEAERRKQRSRDKRRELARDFRDRQLDREGRWLRLETGLHSGAYMYDAEPANSSALFRWSEGTPVEGDVGGAKLSLDLRGSLSPVEMWVLEGRMDVAPFGATRELESPDEVVLADVQGPVGAYRANLRSGLRIPTKAVDITFFAGYQQDRLPTYVADSSAEGGITRQIRPAHLFATGLQIGAHFDVRRKAVREMGFALDLGLGFAPPDVAGGVARRAFGLDVEYGFHLTLEQGFMMGLRLRMSGSFHRYLIQDADGGFVRADSDPDVSEIHLGYGFFVGFAV